MIVRGLKVHALKVHANSMGLRFLVYSRTDCIPRDGMVRYQVSDFLFLLSNYRIIFTQVRGPDYG